MEMDINDFMGQYKNLQIEANCDCPLLSNLKCCVEDTLAKTEQFQSDLNISSENLDEICSEFKHKYLAEKVKVGKDGNNNKQSLSEEIIPKIVAKVSTTLNNLLHVREQIDQTRNVLDEIKCRLNDTINHLATSRSNHGQSSTLDSLPCEIDDQNEAIDNSSGSTVGWKERPLILYKNPKMNRFNQTICCVLLTEILDICHEDLIVHASDTDYDLASCLESNEEQILSCVVTVESKNDTLLYLKGPVHLYLPVLPDIRCNLVPKIKIMSHNTSWDHKDTVQDLILPGQKDVILRGCEVRANHTQRLTCVAIAVPPIENVQLDHAGGDVTLRNNNNIQLSFPAYTFQQPTQVQVKTKTLPPNEVKGATCKYLELENVKRASTLVTIECSDTTSEDFQVILHDVSNAENHRNGTTCDVSLLQEYKEWLVNNLNIDSISKQLSNVFAESFIYRFKEEDNVETKIRLLLSEFESCSDTAVDKFINLLNSTGQTEASVKVASIINFLSENSSDFDPDFEQPIGTVKIVSKTNNHSWRVTPVVTSDDRSHTVELERGHSSYSLLGLVVRDEMLDVDVCKAAAVIEDVACLTYVSLVVRQNKYNPDKVAIHCVKSSKNESCLSQLCKQGYTITPTRPFLEFGLVDGEEIEISFNEFCLEGFERKPFSMTFYSALDTAKYRGRLCVVHPDRHFNSDRYCSQMTYRVVSPKISLQRTGTLTLYLPKPTDEQIGYFSYTLDFTVTAMAKYLALKLIPENVNSTRWIKCAKNLTTDTIYHSIIKHISIDLYRPSERQRCEAFLVYWANHYVYPHENKLERMTDVFGPGESKYKADAQSFIRPFLVSGTLSNERLRQLAKSVSDKWELMAKKLGLSQSAINEIKHTDDNQIRQCLKMLDVWRLSDSAISKGTDIVKHLHECAKAAKCSSSVLKELVGF